MGLATPQPDDASGHAPDRRRRRRRRPGTGPRRLLGATGLTLLALLLAACGNAETHPQTVFDPAGPVARSQDNLWDLTFPFAIGVFIVVQGLIVLAMWRFRDRTRGREPVDRDHGDIPKQVAGNTKLEIAWTVIPAIILVIVAVPTVRTIFELSGPPEGDRLDVRVIGKQYWWEFEYLGDEGQGVVTSTDLHIPTGRPVYLQMQSLSALVNDPGATADVKQGQWNDGVNHSFWVPRLAGKQDLVPHYTRELTIEADEPGIYEGQCAEFCGLSHSRMRFNVVAQEPGEFDTWLTGQTEPAAGEGELSGLAAEGYAEFESATCIACHVIDGYESASGQEANQRIGPNLTHFANRLQMAGGILDVNEENIRAWLQNPQAVKSGSQMPNLQLSDRQLDALTAYLQTLE